MGNACIETDPLRFRRSFLHFHLCVSFFFPGTLHAIEDELREHMISKTL